MAFLGFVRLEKQKSRKQQRSRTVEKQRNIEQGKEEKQKKQRSRNAKKQGNRSQENTQHGKKNDSQKKTTRPSKCHIFYRRSFMKGLQGLHQFILLNGHQLLKLLSVLCC